MTKNTNLKKYGLLGKNINYSFSKKYFTNKFNEEKRFDCKYENYDINSIMTDFAGILEKNYS